MSSLYDLKPYYLYIITHPKHVYRVVISITLCAYDQITAITFNYFGEHYFTLISEEDYQILQAIERNAIIKIPKIHKFGVQNRTLIYDTLKKYIY